MSEIAQAIANRQSEIDRLQAEMIKALTDADEGGGPRPTASPRPSRREEGGIGAHDRLLGRTEEEGGQEVAPPAHRGPGWDGSRLT